MINKIKNLDPNTKFVAKFVATRIVLPIVAMTIVTVVSNKIEKSLESAE